ncbi:hypothetical protein CMU97_08125 [Elizabethkingia anophelis]|nr:hypothetical protein [Elizabethkingia anophelis]MDV3527986.1 hypothetical protein [Elizabethkingia anophelis]
MKKMILPVFVMLIGAGAAFATKTADKNALKLADRQGYIYNFDLEQCDMDVTCSDQPGQICTVDGTPSSQQVFGSAIGGEHPSTCDVTLYKK